MTDPKAPVKSSCSSYQLKMSFCFYKIPLLTPTVAPIDHVYGTLGLTKASTTQQYSDISKLREEIEGKGSFTMFAPSNDAWDQLDSVSKPDVLTFHVHQ